MLPKITLNIHVTLDFLMVVSDFFVKFVILCPIAARFVRLVWLKLGATGCRFRGHRHFFQAEIVMTV